MASKSFDAIVSDIIDNIITVNPLIDVKVGEVVRDIFIDVQSSELETLYGIADNTAKAQSVTTALNSQLDRLAYNYGIIRNPPFRSSTNLTISIKAGIQAPTPCNIGDQFYTVADANNPSIIFVNTVYQLLQPGQTQATLSVISLNPGSTTNVAAYTITQSSYDFADAVYNIDPSTGGLDQESDANFALRIPYNVTGQYLNTSRGIINTVLDIPDINGQPFFVTPDNPQSRGPYTVDVYTQRSAGYFGTTTTETAPANAQNYSFLMQPLYSLNPINQITVFDPLTGQTSIIDQSEYTIINDPIDVQQFYLGSIKSNQQLQWVNAPPTNPYTISYNYDQTIIASQAAYDIHDELTADTLFKQANPIPLYISATLIAVNGANPISVYQTALQNLINMFDDLSITQALPEKQIEATFMQDTNILDLTLSNLDTSFEITLYPTIGSSFLTPSIQSEISPLGYYWEVDPSSSMMSYPIAARLWIGKPDIINANNQNAQTGFNFTQSLNIGIPIQDNLDYAAQWNTNIYPFFDSVNSTLILCFSALPTNGQALILNLIQNDIDTTNNLSYLTLAPSLVSPVEPYPTTVATAIPQYATQLPDGITDLTEAIMYKNGVALMLTTSASIGDYTIVSGPDSQTGLINVQFTTTPAATDLFQFGILNPNLVINFSSSPFSR